MALGRCFLAVAISAGVATAAGCSGPAAERTVTVRVTGPKVAASISIIAGAKPAQSAQEFLPWTSSAVKEPAGTEVLVTVASLPDDPAIFTCQLLSNGKLIAAGSGSDGQAAECSGKV